MLAGNARFGVTNSRMSRSLEHADFRISRTLEDSTKIMSVLACLKLEKSPKKSKHTSSGLRRMTHYEVVATENVAESIENAVKQMAEVEACTPHTTGIVVRLYV